MADGVSKEGHPIGVPFVQDPEYHIDHSDRTKPADDKSADDFRDKSDDPIVQTPKVHCPRVEFIKEGHDLWFDGLPERFEKCHGQSIETWGRGGFIPLMATRTSSSKKGATKAAFVASDTN